VKPKVGSQEVQPACVQVRQPGMAAHKRQVLPLRYMPSRQVQVLLSMTKWLAVSHAWHMLALLQIRHPLLHSRHVLGLKL